MMKVQANRPIKEIIAEFPNVATILDEYGIGCGPCTVGICQLKDILEIHQLPESAEVELMNRIEAEIYPEREREVPDAKGTHISAVSKDQTYSEPIQMLVDEHRLIKRLLARIPQLVDWLDLSNDDHRLLAKTAIDFIRSYADQLHHGKEEAILFEGFDDSTDIFQVIYQDHATGRGYVKQMVAAVASRNSKKFCENLEAYRVLLTEHIQKEDEVLFPWLDSQLSVAAREDLLNNFQRADIELDLDVSKYRSFIEDLENVKEQTTIKEVVDV